MKHYIKILFNRLTSVRKDLLILQVISIITIILVDFWLINIPAPNNFIFHFGQFNLKMCYSFFSAFIFYFLVVHCPRESRKAKSYRQINNKILKIEIELRDIIRTIMNSANYDHKNNRENFDLREITEENFIKACQKVNPQKTVSSISHYPPFPDWFEYLTFKGMTIKKLINDIMLLNDNINNEVLELVTFVDNETTDFMYERKKFGNTSLEHLGQPIYKASKEVNELFSAFRKEYKRYEYKYRRNYILKNKK